MAIALNIYSEYILKDRASRPILIYSSVTEVFDKKNCELLHSFMHIEWAIESFPFDHTFAEWILIVPWK